MSSMVQDAYDMGITTSLGGMPNDTFYNDRENYEYDDSSDEKDEYEVGDTVRLNSGGPLMTIEEVDEEVITCRWFNTTDTLQNAQFNKSEVKFDDENEEYTWYSCSECDWNGTEDELDDDGDCPECGSCVTEDD